MPRNRVVPGLAKRIGEVVERWALERQHRGVVVFSKKAGLSHDSLRKYIQGDQNPDAYALWKIAMLAGVTVDSLVRGEERHDEPANPTKRAEELVGALRLEVQHEGLVGMQRSHALDFVSFVGTQIQRLVYDARRFTAQLGSRSRGEEFSEQEYRRRMLESEQDR